jgi:hypothetical protein
LACTAARLPYQATPAGTASGTAVPSATASMAPSVPRSVRVFGDGWTMTQEASCPA